MGVATLPQEANMLGRSIVILCLTALFVQLSLGQCTFNDGSCMYDFSSLTVAPENFYSASTNASSPTADVFAFNICGTVNTTCGGNDTSVCQTTNSGTPTSYIAGVLSAMQFSSLAGSQENCSGAILEYGDGTSCVSGPRVTYITLTCDEQQDTLAVTSVVEAASCAYYINATSKYACGTQVVVNQTSVTVSTSVSASASSSMTVSPSVSVTASVTPSVGTSPSVSKSISTSASVSPSQSVMATISVTTSMTASVSASQSKGSAPPPESDGGSIWYWWVLATVGCFAIGIIVGVALGFVLFKYIQKRRGYSSIGEY